MASHSALFICVVGLQASAEGKILSNYYEAFKILKRKDAVLIYGNCCFPPVIRFRVIGCLRPTRRQTLSWAWRRGGKWRPGGVSLHRLTGNTDTRAAYLQGDRWMGTAPPQSV